MHLPHLSGFSRLTLPGMTILVALLVIFAQTGPAHSQDTDVFAEAIGEANVRAGPGLDYPLVGKIVVGTKYKLVGRSARFPWFLIQLPETAGWVFADLVKVTGNVQSVPLSEAIVGITPSPSAIPQGQTSTPAAAISPNAPIASFTPTTASTLPPDVVMAEAKETVNVRCGPAIEFILLGAITKGQFYPVLQRHALYPWLELAIPQIPGGRGWVFRDALTVTGSLATVPITSQLEFTCTDLTATPQMVVTSAPPWTGGSAASGDPALTKLSAEVYDYLLKQKFEPHTNQQGSVFLMDLRTRNAISLNPGVAYSGMSLVKIPILTALYRKLSATPNETQAKLIGEMMVCSDNIASNGVLNIIGDGNGYTGATRVNELMQGLSLKDTFMVGPFRDDPKITPQPVNTIKTSANQTSTDPDPYNQATPADLGWLLSSIYQCALDGTGPLMTTYPGDFNVTECRQMVRALSADKIGTLVEAGVPTGTVVAHKHGWINDTHGDAALVLTPGGDYVLTVILHGKTWLSSDISFPVVSEISRMTYNAYNPDKPVASIRLESVPATCTPDPGLIRDLRALSLPPIR